MRSYDTITSPRNNIFFFANIYLTARIKFKYIDVVISLRINKSITKLSATLENPTQQE